jgi:hypothetical protein
MEFKRRKKVIGYTDGTQKLQKALVQEGNP